MRVRPLLSLLHCLPFCLILALLAGACSHDGGSDTTSGPPPESLDRVLEAFNRGVAMMDQYRPGDAVTSFEEVVRLAPHWVPGRLNLGIALLNAQSEELRLRAEEMLRGVVRDDPTNPTAHFALGMLLRHLGKAAEARAEFERVLAIDPEDPDAHYQMAVVLGDLDVEPETARRHLEKALEVMPHHESACYRLVSLLRRAGEEEAAAEKLRRFRALKEAGAGFSSGFNFGEMGRYGDVIRAFPDREAKETTDVAREPELVYTDRAEASGLVGPAGGSPGWPGDDPARIAREGAGAFAPGIAVADIDGDGTLDVYIPFSGDGAKGALYRGAAGRFEIAADTGIDGTDAIGAFFGDFDRDGDPDLYLTCAGPNRLYRNDGGLRFTDVTAATGTSGGPMLSVGAAWADADHDGDLDLYVANIAPWPLEPESAPGAPNALLRNNGDGTFTDVAAAAGVDGGRAATVGVAFFDADDDRDLDLYLVNDRAPNRLFRNDRVGDYRDVTAQFPVLADEGPGTGAVLGDVNRDGREDLLLVRGTAPPRLLLRAAGGRFEEDTRFASAVGAEGGAVGALLGDLDLDGDLDLALVDAGREGRFALWIHRNLGAATFATAALVGSERDAPSARGALAVDLDADGALELLVARAGARPELWDAGDAKGRHWLTVLPSAESNAAENAPHPLVAGLRVEVKTGIELQVGRIGLATGYLGSPPPSAHFGLGRFAMADYVRLDWPDAVVQSEIEVAADRVWTVAKILRKPSSCPVLFAWDGERFAFITDFLGVGGLGFFLAPGEYAPPDPTETVRIPPDRVAPVDGRYRLRVAEPLEEVAYVDELALRVLDHPADLELHPDERFTGSPPFPTGRPFAVREKIFPVAARDDRGEDVLERVLDIDRVYVEPPVDPRFVGYARDHALELDFGDRLRGLPRDAPLVLCLFGWVEYTYSHVNFAADQAGLRMHPPSIEVPDGRGGWTVALEEAGYPAGLPRMMTLDVASLPIREAARFRIRTNMEIFWDQVFLAEDLGTSGVRVHLLRPDVAELRYLGYPREYSPDGENPTLYDYHRLDHGVPFKNMAGDTTRYGDVRDLLRTTDDRFVILGRGEEIALEFDATGLPPLPEGWSRTLFLESDGYCKDMDLYTAYPDTVGPLPYHAMANYPPDEPAPVQERAEGRGEDAGVGGEGR